MLSQNELDFVQTFNHILCRFQSNNAKVVYIILTIDDKFELSSRKNVVLITFTFEKCLFSLLPNLINDHL